MPEHTGIFTRTEADHSVSPCAWLNQSYQSFHGDPEKSGLTRFDPPRYPGSIVAVAFLMQM
jgi:hypothetical protein